MRPRRAVISFVEGSADLRVVFRGLAAAHAQPEPWLDRPAKDLPTPFGAQGSKRVSEGHVLQWNRRRPGLHPPNLHESHEEASPAYRDALILGEVLHLFVLMSGTQRIEEAQKMCAQISTFYNAPGAGFSIEQVAFAFVLDADQAGHYPRRYPDSSDPDRAGWPLNQTPRQLRELWFERRFSALAGGAPPRHGQWSPGRLPVGLYIWHRPDTEAGTLEDLLLPLAERHLGQPLLHRSAAWVQFEQAQDPSCLPGDADPLKARLTLASQLYRPGLGLDGLVVGGRGAQLPSDAFLDPSLDPLRQFYAQIPWSPP